MALARAVSYNQHLQHQQISTLFSFYDPRLAQEFLLKYVARKKLYYRSKLSPLYDWK